MWQPAQTWRPMNSTEGTSWRGRKSAKGSVLVDGWVWENVNGETRNMELRVQTGTRLIFNVALSFDHRPDAVYTGNSDWLFFSTRPMDLNAIDFGRRTQSKMHTWIGI